MKTSSVAVETSRSTQPVPGSQIVGSARTQGERKNNTRAGAWGKKGAVALSLPSPRAFFRPRFLFALFPTISEPGTGYDQQLKAIPS